MSEQVMNDLEEVPDTELVDRRQTRGWFHDPKRTVLLYVAAYVATGLIGAFVSVLAQAILDAVLALIAVNHAIFGYRMKRTAGLVMGALFTTRLMTVTLPATGVSVATRTAMIAAAMILVAYVTAWILRQDVSGGRASEQLARESSRRSRWLIWAIMVLSSVPIGWAAHGLLRPEPLVLRPIFEGPGAFALVIPLVLAAIALMLGALGEELVFRRLVSTMVRHAANSKTPFVSASLYAAAYAGTRNPDFIALMFITGALYAWALERTGSIRPAVASHAIVSVLVFVVLPG